MGMFDRWRTVPEESWRPPALGSCGCEQHVESLTDVTLPYGVTSGRDGELVVSDMLAAEALTVRLALPDETEVPLPHTGQRTGPYHWVVGTTDLLVALYDADAPVQLDDCLSVQPGIDRVALVDAGFAVGAPALCPSGVQAAVVTALTNPRVRGS